MITNDLIKHETARLGQNFVHEHHVVIYENVTIGDQVRLGNNVVIYPDTVIGDHVTILDNAVIGRPPKPGPHSTRKITLPDPLQIGSHVIIGTAAVLYRGSTIGDYVYIADMVHIRERCRIANDVSIGKLSSIEQEVIMGPGVKINGCSQIAEWTEIGAGAFLGADVSTCTDSSFGRIDGASKKVVIGENAMIGTNSTLGPGVTIGANAAVSAGAAVFRHVPEGKVAMGNPAKILWDVNPKLIRHGQA